MLIKFIFENYKSFSDKTVLSAVAASLKGLEEKNIMYSGRMNVLKSLSLYGANASGKSNLLDALLFMRWLVIHSSKDMQRGEKIEVQPFRLSTVTEEAPTMFEMELQIDEVRYRYGFSVTTDAVTGEWLFVTTRQKEYPMFVRKDGQFKLWSRFKEGRGLEDKTRDNALFLSLVAQFNGEQAGKIVEWFDNIRPIQGLETKDSEAATLQFLENENTRNHIKNLIRNADFGIDDIYLSDTQNMDTGLVEVLTAHKKYDEKKRLIGQETFYLNKEESKGTQKFFHLLGTLLSSIEKGQIVVIDELSARLHPLLTKYIISLYNSTENQGAQLIFSTHDTNILDRNLLRRDQIYFVEKDQYGSSNLYSLVQFKHRKESPMDKNYIKGKFGAIPFIKERNELVNT